LPLNSQQQHAQEYPKSIHGNQDILDRVQLSVIRRNTR
jgi:hypothetical protein